ncbi:amino acid transporter [Piedraia hortae CBS 480.64]|uniref:Amino acid transporter n=1 Tax=Piedraia hortae CBS 480.64 TaxID=1314780 RepID=A0A6A7C7Y7_9PEZI|nr:amino acid transporter [Piedraia hortae CBS 480.64]
MASNMARRQSVSTVEMRDRDGAVRVLSIDELNEADQALAAEFGYKPVFQREFGYWSSFSFAVSISGLFSTIATTFSYPLSAGGSASAVWCWLISGAGCMCIACSVSELVSAYPTSGGLYYTVSHLTPRKWVPVISWVTGWLNLLGQVAGVASSEWGSAALLLAAVSMGSDFTYSPTVGQTVAVMAGLTVITGVVNSLSTFWMEKMTKSYVIFHVLVLVCCSIALLVMSARAGTIHTAKYVFTDVDGSSGWTPTGWAFLFGFLSVSWTMTDYDATAHITEEIRDPERKAPWAISLAMLFTYLAGWLFNIVLCFSMGDMKDILASPIQQPVAQLFYNVLGKSGGITFTVCAIIILQFVCFTAMQALGRTVFAFSRDSLVPFSRVWTRILPLTGTPILAVWLCVCLCVAINLIGLGSYTAIAGVFNVCAISLDISYCIPILCKVCFGKFRRGPWHLGKWSLFVNVWACIWTSFVTIIFLLPTARPVTAENMNFAVVYLIGIIVFALIFWHVHGKKFYTGPIVEADAPESPRPSGEGKREKDVPV